MENQTQINSQPAVPAPATLYEEVKEERASEGLTWGVAGILIGFVGVIIFPSSVILGPVSIYLSARCRSLGRHKLGTAGMALGAIFTVIGLILTVLFGGDLLLKFNRTLDYDSNITGGRSLYHQARYPESLKTFEGALNDADSATRRATIYYWIGNNHFMLRNYQQAELSERRALSDDAGYVQPYITLTKIYLVQGKLEKALETSREGIDLGQDDPELYYVYGQSLKQNDKKFEAINAFKKALEISPDNEIYKQELSQLGGQSD